MKKTPIFVKMLLPIICVMLAQSGIVAYFLFLSGTVQTLNDNAIDLVTINTEFRESNLQDLMLRYWSNLSGLEAEVGNSLQAFMDGNGIDVDGLLGNRCYELKWLYNFSDNIIEALDGTMATGIFIYFLDGVCPSKGGTRHLNGLYIRNLSALPNIPANLMFLTGYYTIARRHGISQDALWTEQFVFCPENYGMWRGFAYPQIAAAHMQNAPTTDLSFWNPKHYFSARSAASGGQITYSRPVFLDGRMVAIIGTEIQFSSITEQHLPVRDFYYLGESGYVITLGNPAAAAREIVHTSGMFVSNLFHDISEITMKQTDRPGVYALAEVPGVRMVYRPIVLYNATSYFAAHQWALTAISTERALFSVSRNLVHMIFIGMAIAISSGALLLYVTVKRVTRPIGLITNQLLEKGGNESITYKPSSAEIDLLCDTINSITEQRIAAENQVREERHRYLLALESSGDTFIEYETESDTLHIFYFMDTPQQLPESKVIRNFSQNPHLLLHPSDVIDSLQASERQVRVLASALPHIKNVEPVDGYLWAAIKTIVINDSTEGRKKTKIIGTARDITKEKVQQLNAIEANRSDITSGFYNRSYGLAKISAVIKECSSQCEMRILCIENFSTLELNLGLVFGGIFIAEFSHILRGFVKGENSCTTRLSNDKFLVFYDEPDGFDEEGLMTAFGDLYTGGGADVALSIESFELADNFQSLLNENYSPIKIFMDLNNKANLTNAATELLERSSNVESSVRALLGLVGRLFKLERVVLCDCNTEFLTDRIVLEWNSPGAEAVYSIRNITLQAFEQFKQMLDDDNTLVFDGKTARSAISDLFLYLDGHNRSDVFCYAAQDVEKYAERIIFMADKREWTDDEKHILRTVAKIILGYMEMERTRSVSKAKSDFLSRVSHEIRTPMNVIIGINNIAKEAVKSGDIPRAVDCLNKLGISADYLNQLINDVLEMSRIENGKLLVIENKPFNLDTLVNEMEAVIRFTIESTGCEFVVVRDFTNVHLLGDQNRIKQVLFNLLGNANKFTGQGGTITLSVIQKGNGLYEFSVSDTGVGIPPEKLAVIFEAFEQVGTSEISQRGTGLGLPISRNIINAMGSEIAVVSEYGAGSTFKFVLELAGNETAAEEHPPDTDYNRFFKGKRALVADDVETNLEVISFILQNEGFKVETANDGQQAVDKFASSPYGYFDVVMMDIQMPVMDGLTAASHIHSFCEKTSMDCVPIIAVTANAFDRDWIKSAESGMVGHVNKPINRDELFALLKKIM